MEFTEFIQLIRDIKIEEVTTAVEATPGLATRVYSDSNYPLHLAALVKSVEIAKVLIDAGAQIDRTNAHGETALIGCISSGSVEVAEYLISEGASLNGSEKRRSPLEMCIGLGNLDMFSILVKAGATVIPSLVYIAIVNGRQKSLEFLVDNGVSIDLVDENGMTLLHVAAKSGNYLAVNYLVGQGAKMDAENSDGKKPIEFMSDTLEIIKATIALFEF